MKLKKSNEDNLIDDMDFGRQNKSDIFPKWQELKPEKNIHRRSYHSCVVYDQSLYVYGGYENNEGILEDFNKIPLPSTGKPFQWSLIYKRSEDDNNTFPGPLRNHTAVIHKTKMYMLGGKESLIFPTGKLWIFDFETELWKFGGECEYNGKVLALEGHGANVWAHEDSMVIFGGFYTDQGYVSSILQYKINDAIWEVIFDGIKPPSSAPKGRAEAGTIIIGSDLFVFGGCNYEVRFNDFWKFDLNNKQWGQIITEKSPGARSSTILIQSNSGILLFGGIHDITHEKNDLWIYKGNEWLILEEDNSRRQVQDEQLNDSVADKASQGRPNKDKGKKEMQNRSFLFEEDNSKGMQYSPKRNSLRNIPTAIQQKQPTEPMNNSSTNNMEELKKRRIQQKKMQMLAEFDLTEEEKNKFRNSSPTTEQIKNSLSLIMNQDKTGNQRKQSPAGRKQIQASLYGKKPCARDGHTAIVAGEYMIVFGGDRNLMSFNDIYMYSLKEKQ